MKGNELQLIFGLLRRWSWLLILGAIIGASAGYGISLRNPPIYRASTNIMVSQPVENLASDLSGISDSELAETFRSMIFLRPVLDATIEQIGGRVSAGQISSSIIEGTSLLNITVQDGDPERAVLIANALVESLVKQNELLQSGRFEASEESLQAQIAEVESQIADITAQQEETEGQNQVSDEELVARKQELQSAILDLSNKIAKLEQEILNLASPDPPPSSPPFSRNILSDNQLEIKLLQLKLNAAETRHQQMVADGALDYELQVQQEEILGLSEEIIKLEWVIEDLSPDESLPVLDLATQELLIDKKAELTLLRLDLDIADERYRQLNQINGEVAIQSDQASIVQETNLALYEQIYVSLRSHYEAVRLARVQSTPSIVQVDRAVPSGPIQANPISNAFLGATIGLFVMGAIAFLVEFMDDTLKDPADIELTLDLPVVGFIAQTPELGGKYGDKNAHHGTFVSNNSRSPVAEAFRTLRTNLEFVDIVNPLKTILLTSPGPREGKTTISANLASVFAQQQKRVIILDCDLRKPSMHKLFGVANRVGLSNVLLGQLELQDAIHFVDSELALVTSGTLPSNPAELLGSQRMSNLLGDVAKVSDIVVIDSPPSIVTDATVLSAMVDGVVVVIQPGHTRTGEAQAAVEQLRRANANVLGVVLSQISRNSAGNYGRYGYENLGYSYDYADESEEGGNRSGRRGIRGRLPRPFRKKSAIIQ